MACSISLITTPLPAACCLIDPSSLCMLTTESRSPPLMADFSNDSFPTAIAIGAVRNDSELAALDVARHQLDLVVDEQRRDGRLGDLDHVREAVQIPGLVGLPDEVVEDVVGGSGVRARTSVTAAPVAGCATASHTCQRRRPGLRPRGDGRPAGERERRPRS